MEYDLYINKDQVGNGLSRGELSSWLVDLYEELDFRGKLLFLLDFNIAKIEDIYDTEIVVPFAFYHNKDQVEIIENEF